MSSFPALVDAVSAPRPLPVSTTRRRGSRAQGRALETLGHAVEYLIDSRRWETGSFNPQADQEAVQILMRMSRAVFVECPEVVSIRRRLGFWITSHRGPQTSGAEHW